MLVSFGRNWSKELEIGSSSSDFPVCFPGYVAVRGIGSSYKEEWFAGLYCVVEETVRFSGQDVSGVLA